MRDQQKREKPMGTQISSCTPTTRNPWMFGKVFSGRLIVEVGETREPCIINYKC